MYVKRTDAIFALFEKKEFLLSRFMILRRYVSIVFVNMFMNLGSIVSVTVPFYVKMLIFFSNDFISVA